MAMDTFKRLWPAIRSSKRVHLQGWGEPLMSPDFFQMAALARKAGCAVSTTTCGLLINEEMARKIVDTGFDIIAFSLAGTDAATNSVRKGVDFGMVYQSISTLQKIRRACKGFHLQIHIAYMMLASAVEAVKSLPAMAGELGVHSVVVSTLDYVPDPGLEQEAFYPGGIEKLQAAAEILREAESAAESLGVDFHWSLPRSDAPGDKCRENISRSFFVASDGAVSPCVYVNLPIEGGHPYRLVFGNVNERDVLEIWADEKFRVFRERLSKGCPATICKKCPKRFMD